MIVTSGGANQNQGPAVPSNPITLPVPGLIKPRGAGDVFAALTQRLGIKPCTPCKQRQAQMNQAVQFVPWGQR